MPKLQTFKKPGDPSSNNQAVRPISAIIRAIDVFADPWTYLILREAFFGVRRFDVLQRNLRISRNSLTERLQHMVAEGILERDQYTIRPQRFEYRLTDSGRDFYPAIVMILSWGDRWCKSMGSPPLHLFHKTCGKRLSPVVVCSHCQKPLAAQDVTFMDGPGAGFEALPAARETRRRGGEGIFLRGRPCSVARALQSIGDRWSFRILRESFRGARRFEDILANTGAARNILTARLNGLVDNGILERREYLARPPRSEYILTTAGMNLYPSLLMFMAWGDRWRPAKNGRPLLLKHSKCGELFSPQLICGKCDTSIRPQDVRYKMAYDLAALLGGTR